MMTNVPEDVTLETPASRVAVVSFTGEHDLGTRDEIRDLLTRLVHDNRLVVTDFSKAQFVDSSILAAVRSSARLARDRGVTFRVQLGTAPIVAMSFKVSGVLDELECVPTREEALSDASSGADSGS